jgi:serine protease Do
VQSSIDLPRIVGGTLPGTTVPVEVWRDGETTRLTIKVGELKDDATAASEVPAPPERTELAANRLGIVVREIESAQARELGLDHGLLVTDVRPDARAELRPGDVLTTMVHDGKRTPLKSASQFDSLLKGLGREAVITLQVRRGSATAFVTVSGLPDRG